VNDGRRAQIVAEIFDTPAAQEQYLVIRGLGSLCEWSFGFRVLEASTEQAELDQFPGAKRILKELEVFEVSAVFSGAGIGTQTDSAKAIRLSDLGIAPEWLADIGKVGMVRLADLGMTSLPSHVTQSRLVDLRTL